MDNKYTEPRQPKEVKSFTLSKENIEWLEQNIPAKQRSAFMDDMLNRRIRYIRRQVTSKAQVTA